MYCNDHERSVEGRLCFRAMRRKWKVSYMQSSQDRFAASPLVHSNSFQTGYSRGCNIFVSPSASMQKPGASPGRAIMGTKVKQLSPLAGNQEQASLRGSYASGNLVGSILPSYISISFSRVSFIKQNFRNSLTRESLPAVS